MRNEELLDIGHWKLDIEVGSKRMLFNQITDLQFGI